MPEYGIYKGRVVNNNDPTGTGRMKLQVPQLFGQGLTNWALPAQHIRYSANIGDQVWVSFEGGDTSKPLWWGGEPTVSNQIQAAETYAYNLALQAQTNAAAYSDVETRNNTATYTKSSTQSISSNIWTTVTGFVLSSGTNVVEDVDQNTALSASSSVLSANVPGVWFFDYTLSFSSGTTGIQMVRIVDSSTHIEYARSMFDSSSLVAPVITCNTSIFLGGTSGASINTGFSVQAFSNSAAIIAGHGLGTPCTARITMLRRL